MKKTFSTVLLACAAAASAMTDAEFEAKRAELLAKPRYIMTDNDGNDIVYYDRDRPVTEEAFIDMRIGYVAKTRAETMIYCPWSAGFGYFTVPDVGDLYTNYVPYQNTTNRTAAFLEQGKNSLQMAIDFCRREKREAYLGIRMNDTHDAGYDELFPPWKRENPDCLFGTKQKRPYRCSWSAVDFENPKTRAYMLKFMRQFLEKYDVDGIEYDFFRHCQLFKSVAWTANQETSKASPAQLDLMTEFMAQLRALSEEFGRKRCKPILVAIRVPDSFRYNRCVGIDLENWLKRKTADLVIIGGYWQFHPWRETVKRIHALGAKCYVSLDESRIGWYEKSYRHGYLPGRQTAPFYHARMAAAMADGADGVCFFNCQGTPLATYASVDPNATEGYAKNYFAVERGSGGYEPNYYVFYGSRFSTMPDLDPQRPHLMHPATVYGFDVVVGDDFSSPVAKERPPRATAELMINLAEKADFRLRVNDVTLGTPVFTPGKKDNGVLAYQVPTELLKRGPNRFEVEAPFTAPKGQDMKLVDFVLRLSYPPKKAK